MLKFSQRYRGTRISVMLGQAGFNQTLIGLGQRRIIKLQRSANQNLPLFEGKSRKLSDDFVETHDQRLTATAPVFQ
jgi:hypothetical protein